MCSGGYATNVSSEVWWLKEPWLTAMRQVTATPHSGGYVPYPGSSIQPMAGYDSSLPPQIDWVAINRAIAESS